ncbi:hypothetical protein BOX15_Mlig000585g4 [Macrostomum lignano]|nr:hypothetical protein BOX15_Mlig000585g4 [Macrostomum lignano]
MALGSSSVASTLADQEAVAYTPRLRGQQQPQQLAAAAAASEDAEGQKRRSRRGGGRRQRRTRTSSADTLLSGQNSLLMSPGGDCSLGQIEGDGCDVDQDEDEFSSPESSDGGDNYSTASTDVMSSMLTSPMSSLPAPPSPPDSPIHCRRRQVDADACECRFASLLSSEAAYSLSSLDTASLAHAGIRVLESGSSADGAGGDAAGNDDSGDSDKAAIASVSEARSFYCDWTAERLRRHLSELTARLPGQEFRPVRSLTSTSAAAVTDDDKDDNAPQFRGSLRVHVNLMRPVRAEQPSAAFFLPRGNATLLHDLDSRDTADRVVSLLLAKHRIRDPPHKFALFEHEIRGDRTVIVRKLMQHERPLEILLSWTTLPPAEMQLAFERRKFILQENESSTVDWHAFTIPELNNFLLILSLEEEQRAKEIRLTFDITRSQLRRRLFELEKQQKQQKQQQAAVPNESDA